MLDRRTLLAALAGLPLLGSASCAYGTDRPAPSRPALHRTRIPGAEQLVPVAGIGTGRRYADPQGEEQLAQLRQTVARFVELGGWMIYTAPSYGRAEDVIGTLVEQLGVRDRLFLATKVGADSPTEGRAQIAQSFRNLRTDTIDLIAVHNL